MKILVTSSLASNFTGSYKKKRVFLLRLNLQGIILL